MTYGVLNLSHRDSHEYPQACPVGEPFKATIKLNDFARTIPKGHRLRLAIQTQFWFVLWPQPDLATITVTERDIAPSPAGAPALASRPESEFRATRDCAARRRRRNWSPAAPKKRVEDDLGNRDQDDPPASMISGTTRLDDRGIVTASSSSDTFTIHPDDPLSAKLVSEYRWSMRSGEADTEARSRTELTADRENFYLTWRIEALEGGRIIHSKQATRKFTRDFC